MDIYWYGQSFFKIKGKTTTLFVDPFGPEFTGLRLPKDMQGDLKLSTHSHEDHNNLGAITGDPVRIEGPGEYEAKGVTVVGLSVYHDKAKGAERGRNTIYNIEVDGLHIVHLGDLGHILSDTEVEDVGLCDILMVPVGGVYTIDAKEASEVVAQLEPKVIIPMHFFLDGLKFQLGPLDPFLKEMGVEDYEALNKLVITKDKLPDEPKVVVLNRA